MDEPEACSTRLEQDVRVIKELGATKLDLVELKAELSAKLAVTKADILVRLAEVEGGLRSEMAGLRSDVRSEALSLRTDIERMKSSLLVWIIAATFIGQLLPALLKHFS